MVKNTWASAALRDHQRSDAISAFGDAKSESEFLSFLSEARRAYPQFTFIRTGPTAAWILTDPDDLYAVAKITYEDARVKSSGPTVRTYNLYSRTITNMAVRDDRDEFNLRKSKTPDRTLRDIGTYVKPLTARELVSLTTDAVNDKLQAFYSPLVANRDRLRREIGVLKDTPACRYLLSMGRAQMGTLPPDMASVAAFVEAHEEIERFNLTKRAVRAVVSMKTVVHVIERSVYTRYDGAPSLLSGARVRDDASEIYVPGDVPQIIQDRVNVLNITEGMEFIPEVGIKHSDRVFYVVI